MTNCGDFLRNWSSDASVAFMAPVNHRPQEEQQTAALLAPPTACIRSGDERMRRYRRTFNPEELRPATRAII